MTRQLLHCRITRPNWRYVSLWPSGSSDWQGAASAIRSTSAARPCRDSKTHARRHRSDHPLSRGSFLIKEKARACARAFSYRRSSFVSKTFLSRGSSFFFMMTLARSLSKSRCQATAIGVSECEPSANGTCGARASPDRQGVPIGRPDAGLHGRACHDRLSRLQINAAPARGFRPKAHISGDWRV